MESGVWDAFSSQNWFRVTWLKTQAFNLPRSIHLLVDLVNSLPLYSLGLRLCRPYRLAGRSACWASGQGGQRAPVLGWLLDQLPAVSWREWAHLAPRFRGHRGSSRFCHPFL